MDLVKRAGQLKAMLVKFAMSPLFDRERSEVIAESFPDRVVDNEARFSMVLDHFVLQHRLESGITVVEAFVAAHSELTGAERDMLLGWQDVVEGIFEVKGKDRGAAVLFNLVDELTYRAQSNLGPQAFRKLKKGMIIIGRLVPIGEAWMVSGNLSAYPASARSESLVAAARQALNHPELAFRNPAKLAQAQDMVAEQREAFVDLFGADSSWSPVSKCRTRWTNSIATGLTWSVPMPSLLDPYPWTFPTRSSTPRASRSTSSRARE